MKLITCEQKFESIFLAGLILKGVAGIQGLEKR
jgi:hypothetical protein